MKLITFISAGIFIVVAAFAMKKENPYQVNTFYNTKWSLKKIYTESGIQEVNTKAFIKFNREKKSAGGNGSCNTFGSNITVSNNEISFKNIFSTKMYCEGVQQTEDAFLNQLMKANRIEVKNKSLVLYQGDKILLEFHSE